MSKLQKINIYLESYNPNSLSRAVDAIIETASRSGSKVSGPIPFPVRTQKFTVLRAPHAHKESQDQFEIRTHRRLVTLEIPPQSSAVGALRELKLGFDVVIQIKV